MRTFSCIRRLKNAGCSRRLFQLFGGTNRRSVFAKTLFLECPQSISFASIARCVRGLLLVGIVRLGAGLGQIRQANLSCTKFVFRIYQALLSPSRKVTAAGYAAIYYPVLFSQSTCFLLDQIEFSLPFFLLSEATLLRFSRPPWLNQIFCNVEA